MPVLAASVFPQPGHQAQGREGKELKFTLITKDALWKSSIEEHHLSSLVPLSLPPSVPAKSLSTYKDRDSQTDERLDFNMVLKQLQVVTWAKSQIWVGATLQTVWAGCIGGQADCHKQQGDWKIQGKAEKEIDKVMLLFQEDAAKWKEKLADKQEDQWAAMHEQHNTTLRDAMFKCD